MLMQQCDQRRHKLVMAVALFDLNNQPHAVFHRPAQHVRQQGDARSGKRRMVFHAKVARQQLRVRHLLHKSVSGGYPVDTVIVRDHQLVIRRQVDIDFNTVGSRQAGGFKGRECVLRRAAGITSVAVGKARSLCRPVKVKRHLLFLSNVRW